MDPRWTRLDRRLASISSLAITATAGTRFARSRPNWSEPYVAERMEDAGDANSISRNLFLRRFADAVIQVVSDGDGRSIGGHIGDGMTTVAETFGRICDPPGDRFFPDITLIAVSLFRLSESVKFRCIEPPGLTSAKPFEGFGPKLIAVAGYLFDFDLSAAADGPESPSASRIDQVVVGVSGSAEDALTRGGNQAFSVRRAEAIDPASDESLDMFDIGFVHTRQLTHLDDPDTHSLQRSVFGS